MKTSLSTLTATVSYLPLILARVASTIVEDQVHLALLAGFAVTRECKFTQIKGRSSQYSFFTEASV